MIRVCLVGVGRTGTEIAKVLLEQKDMKLVAALCSPESKNNGKDIGELIGGGPTGILLENSDDIEEIVFRTRPDVAIDFSSPEISLKNALSFAKMKVHMVIGTTGFSSTSIRRMRVLTRKYGAGIVYAPNITLGINVMMMLTQLAANLLNNYDFQITEVHHRHKKDAPSGTALKIAGEITRGLRHAGVEQGMDRIPIHAVRAGGVVGRHEVMIVGEDDKLEISHESFSRKAFARGALQAVRFIYCKSGYYEMNEVLDIRKVLQDYINYQNPYNSKKQRIALKSKMSSAKGTAKKKSC